MMPGIIIHLKSRCFCINRCASPQDWIAMTISFSKTLIWEVNIKKGSGKW